MLRTNCTLLAVGASGCVGTWDFSSGGIFELRGGETLDLHFNYGKKSPQSTHPGHTHIQEPEALVSVACGAKIPPNGKKND